MQMGKCHISCLAASGVGWGRGPGRRRGRGAEDSLQGCFSKAWCSDCLLCYFVESRNQTDLYFISHLFFFFFCKARNDYASGLPCSLLGSTPVLGPVTWNSSIWSMSINSNKASQITVAFALKLLIIYVHSSWVKLSWALFPFQSYLGSGLYCFFFSFPHSPSPLSFIITGDVVTGQNTHLVPEPFHFWWHIQLLIVFGWFNWGNFQKWSCTGKGGWMPDPQLCSWRWVIAWAPLPEYHKVWELPDLSSAFSIIPML